MAEVTFWGSSDDQIIVNDEQYDVNPDKYPCAVFRVSCGDEKYESIDVHCFYSKNGIWVFAPALAVDESDQEDIHVPKWAETIYLEDAENWYSTRLVLFCPGQALSIKLLD